MILAGNGVVRQSDAEGLQRFAEATHIPLANIFMAKGVMAFSHPLPLGTIGLKARDLPCFAFEATDLVICIGHDRVEYPPELCNPNGDKVSVPVDALQAEVDPHYNVRCGGLGDTGEALTEIAEQVTPRPDLAFTALREAIVAERDAHAGDTGFPLKPQRILWDLR